MASRVLIVDDDRDFVEINKVALEAAGYEVVTAYDGDKGFRKAREENPEIQPRE